MKNARVLIADDDSYILQFLSDHLSDDCCVVGTVSEGKALTAAAMELHPHIIITDIDMPTMDGLTAIRQIEALMPDSKVIVLTDHEEPELAEEAIAAGASAFLIKNGSPELIGKIKAIIRDLTREALG
ncbi:MAG TPA: response regulator transcription factor [Candidatus Deferrimicrobium sp.]|nr:response regulator transcription factor [Candidatus Deferrimicrobium sp.]